MELHGLIGRPVDTQIAYELQRSGRSVTLSVGEHIRMPRLYRGRDIKWWMDASGVLDERYDEIADINRGRSLPSLPLTGSDDRRTCDTCNPVHDKVEFDTARWREIAEEYSAA